MRKAYLGLFIGMAISALLLASCNSGSKILTEEDICQAVFETIQNGDEAAFTNFLITDELLAELTSGLDESSAKEKSIKDELLGEDIAKMNAASLEVFNGIITQATTDKLDLKTGVYQGIVNNETRVAVSAFSGKKVEFKIEFDTRLYYVRLDVLQSDDVITVYDVKMISFDKIDISVSEPTENPLVITKGESVDVKVDFDAAAANEAGAWIQTLFDGKNAGMLAGTTLETPYMSDIPAEALEAGKHTVIYRLQPSGSRTYRPLGEAVLEIEVK